MSEVLHGAVLVLVWARGYGAASVFGLRNGRGHACTVLLASEVGKEHG